MILPSYTSLKRNYPTGDGMLLKQDIGGDVTQSWLGQNTCVMRMCKAFNYAGKMHEIPRRGYMHVVRGADGKYYGYKVLEFIKFLTSTYGNPDVKSDGNAISIKDFKGQQGIIAWHINGWNDARGHFTLWDGNAGLYEGAHHYFKDFRTHRPGPGEVKTPYLTEVQLWLC